MITAKQLTFDEFFSGLDTFNLLWHHCAGDEKAAWGQCEKCGYRDECTKLPARSSLYSNEGFNKNLDCPEGVKNCVSCKFYHFCGKIADSSDRRMFMQSGAGCCSFDEKTLLCVDPAGIHCRLKKRQDYRCPIRHGDEPSADPSLEEMHEWKKNGLNPRNGQQLKSSKKRKVPA